VVAAPVIAYASSVLVLVSEASYATQPTKDYSMRALRMTIRMVVAVEQGSCYHVADDLLGSTCMYQMQPQCM
jgi:hypothetical protein